MRQTIRFIICVLSILALTTTIVQASEPAASGNQFPQSQQPDTHPEKIPKSYVQIEIPQAQTMGFEPQAVIQEMASLVPTVKAHSLLNWKSLGRPEEFLVESYQRVHHFGKWVNDKRDKNCYNTRAKVLIRDSSKPVVFKENNCTVDRGEWKDPFSNSILTDAITEVQVDHLVPLKNAYVAGAYKWDYRSRCLYANFLGSNYHLKAIDGDENNLKSDNSPVRYLPTNPEYRCTFLRNWLLVKTTWNLEMSPREASAIQKAIEDEKCNPKQFQITVGEINEHRRFVKANLDLCPAQPLE